jgi:hypothetical protein
LIETAPRNDLARTHTTISPQNISAQALAAAIFYLASPFSAAKSSPAQAMLFVDRWRKPALLQRIRDTRWRRAGRPKGLLNSAMQHCWISHLQPAWDI